jgi:hypothetical protein
VIGKEAAQDRPRLIQTSLLLFDSIEDQRANRVKSWKLWGSIWGVEMREEEMWGEEEYHVMDCLHRMFYKEETE